MTTPRTEAICRLGILWAEDDETRALTYDEMCSFVDSATEHLLGDERVIDPVVTASVTDGTIEIVFEMMSTIAERNTSVAVFDIVHDMGSALGAQWRNSTDAPEEHISEPSKPSTMLTHRERHIRDIALLAPA